MGKNANETPLDLPPGEPDPLGLLPAEMREDWIVLPRRSAYWLFAIGVLLGTGLGLSVAGFLFGSTMLAGAFPVALLLGMAGQRLLVRGHEERKVRELARLLAAGAPPRGRHP